MVGAWRARVPALGAATLGVVGGVALGLAVLVGAPAVGGGRPARSAATMLALPESVASVIAPAGAMAPMSTRDREEDGP